MSTITRLFDRLLPAPSENRFVGVATVSRGSLPLVEDSLADVGVLPMLREVKTMSGQSRFEVLVTARDAGVASQVVAASRR